MTLYWNEIPTGTLKRIKLESQIIYLQVFGSKIILVLKQYS